jgi:response regulator NasT
MPPQRPSSTQIRTIVVDEQPQRRDQLAAALSAVGCLVVAAASLEDDLLPLIEREDPDVIIMDMAAPGRDALESLAYVQSRLPRPIIMFSQDDDSATIRRAVQAGVSAYVVDGLQAKRVRPIVEAAIARFEKFRSLEQELVKTREQLAERKTVERAKGLIMRQRGVSEEEGYQARRKLAMRSNRRLAEVAESIIAAAELLI